MKPKGWRNESRRHSLASKGIKTAQKIPRMAKHKECPNCQGENARTGYVEEWDGVCPECGRKIEWGED